jgi:ADP-heptose:LPS heptosyltransferase
MPACTNAAVHTSMDSLTPDARILAICVARLGDTLLVTPALRALRAAVPRGSLTVLAHPKRRALLEHLPFIDHLGSIDKYSASWRGWFPGKPYDWGVVYGKDAALVRYALRVCRQVIAQRQHDESLNRRLDRMIVPATEFQVAVDARLALATTIGAPLMGRALSYRVTAEEQAQAGARLRALLPDATRLVGLQLQSFPSKAYRDWPVENFEGLAQRLLRQDGIGIVVLGGPESTRIGEDFARRLSTQFPGRAASLAGHTTLREGAAVIGELDLYVGVDTGPTHVAGALGVPMVALYHWRHRGCWLAPQEHPALSVIEHPTPDESCGDDTSMADIPLEVVADAAEERLARGKRRP